MQDFEKIHKKMLEELSPTLVERRSIEEISNRLLERLEHTFNMIRKDLEVRLDGSVAKDTWIRGEADIDVFIKLPSQLPRSFLEIECLKLAREAVSGYKIVERYAEHPYLETWISNIRINIVPCYNVRVGEWLSAADRTPYHTDYMKKKLDQNKKGDVRILKKLLKSTDLYGAEIKTNGFSGFLCEILILHYGSLRKLLQAASNWKAGEIIDIEGYYSDKEEYLFKLFNEPLIVIDPVDRSRNAAAAVSEQNLWSFVALAREFLEHPSRDYFYLKLLEIGIASIKELINNYRSDIIILDIGRVDAIIDVVWGQLYKTARVIRNRLEKLGFHIIRERSWSSDDCYCIILFEVESAYLKDIIEHIGPPVSMKESSDSFLRKHLHSKDTLVGPYIDKGRWKVEKKRRITDISSALKMILKDKGSMIIPERFYSKLKTDFKMFLNEEIVDFYEKNVFTKETIYIFLLGRPIWLDKRGHRQHR